MPRQDRRYVEAAVGTRAFGVVYQPIVHLETGTVSGVEALCRFHDGRPPDLWFKQCEALGLANVMDLAIIEVALRDLDRLPPGYLSLNLSASTLSDPRPLRDLLFPALRRKPIVLELTEHAMVEDYDAVAGALGMLREAGILLAVDDAGAGYASFQHILRLRPDIIKLDRSITHRIDEDPARRALASAIVIFAAEMDASVVAEGVETELELVALRAAGVGRGQGYWLARPGPLPLAPMGYEPLPYIDLVRDGLTTRPIRLDLGNGDDGEHTLAVLAHGALSSMASISSAIQLFQRSDGALPREEYRALCAVMRRQVDSVAALLEDLVRGMPPEVIRDLGRVGHQRS